MPHITLKSIANNEPPAEEVLVDRPETNREASRVSGPFVVEATIPTPIGLRAAGRPARTSATAPTAGSPTGCWKCSAKARVATGRKPNGHSPEYSPARQDAFAFCRSDPERGRRKPVAFVFGPENGAVSEKLVHRRCAKPT